jgi:hypothetical protein
MEASPKKEITVSCRLQCIEQSKKTEAVFVNLLRSPGIYSHSGEPVRTTTKTLFDVPARHAIVVESILGSLNVYNFGLSLIFSDARKKVA